MVTNMEHSNLDDKDSVILPLIYPEDSGNEEDGTPTKKLQGPHEATIKPPFMDPTSEPGPLSKKKLEPKANN